MKRENRYLVIKRLDIKKYLTIKQEIQLTIIAGNIRNGRILDNKVMEHSYVVIAEDWPMYEDTWIAIEKWVDNK